MSNPLVTIGIPFYNAEKYLLDAIKSIFAQTFQDWELILVDDGSTDNSLGIAKSINDPRVRIISDGKNKKLAARLNQIIDLARGEYIVRMDADDLCFSKRIEKQLELFLKDPKLDVAGTGIVYLDLDDIPLGNNFAPTSHAEICMKPARTFGLCHASIIARKSWHEKHRYDETIHLGQDFNLWLRSYQGSKFANIPEPLYYYRLEFSYSLKKQCRDRYMSSIYLFGYYQKQGCFYKALFCFFMQYMKMIAEIIFCAVGAKRKLLSQRYNRLTNAEVESYISEIKRIKNTRLPIKSGCVFPKGCKQ